MRFDAPKAKIRRSWPGVRGASCSHCSNETVRLLNLSLSFCVLLSRHDPAPLRGFPCDLGVHAVHRSDLQHHSVSVPWAGVGDSKRHAGRVAPHPHHGHLQHVRLRWQGEFKRHHWGPSPAEPNVEGSVLASFHIASNRFNLSPVGNKEGGDPEK